MAAVTDAGRQRGGAAGNQPYGQHLTIWDRMYGSLRRYGRRYGIEVFGGEGAPAGVTRAQVRFVDYGRASGRRGDPAATESPGSVLG